MQPSLLCHPLSVPVTFDWCRNGMSALAVRIYGVIDIIMPWRAIILATCRCHQLARERVSPVRTLRRGNRAKFK
jgi:hypothetical protein